MLGLSGVADVCTSGYLLAIGAALWFGAQSAGWILAGQILCLLSVLPLGLYLYQWVEEWRFVALQKELDKAEEADESMFCRGAMSCDSLSNCRAVLRVVTMRILFQDERSVR